MAREETVILDFEVDESDSVESIQSITKASKELREERSKLNLQSVEGQKRVKEINAALDSNNQKIKENVSALEKQKINVGNYKSALDGVHPALGKVGQGLEAGTNRGAGHRSAPRPSTAPRRRASSAPPAGLSRSSVAAAGRPFPRASARA